MQGTLVKQITYDELLILVVHLVRDEGLLLSGIEHIKDEDFSEAEASLRVIWQSARDFFKAYRKLPLKEFLRTDVLSRCSKTASLNHQYLLENICKQIELIYAWPELLPQYAISILESVLWQRHVGPIIMSMAASQHVSESMWEKLSREAQNTKVGFIEDVQPFGGDHVMVGVEPRKPTGVTFLDEMLGGGTRTGELIGFLAPSGTGKTTITHQLAIEHAYRAEHVVVFTYEEPPNNDYMISVHACACKVPKSKWEHCKNAADITASLSADELDRYYAARNKIGKYLHYANFSGHGKNVAGAGGATEIDAALRFYEDRVGAPITMFAIDWFWPMVLRSYEMVPVSYGKKMEIRAYAQQTVDAIKQIASSHRSWCWVTHQIAAADSGKKSLSFENAGEVKSFAWWMNGCFALARLCEKEPRVSQLHFSKARSAKPTTIMVQLKGEISTFVKLEEEMARDAASDQWKKKSEINKVPGTTTNEEASSIKIDYEGPGRVKA